MRGVWFISDIAIELRVLSATANSQFIFKNSLTAQDKTMLLVNDKSDITLFTTNKNCSWLYMI